MNATFPIGLQSTRRALLVGAAQYQHPDECPDLRTPAADVEAMADVLQRPECGFSATTLIDPTKTQFASEIEEMLGKAGREDTVLLYFSGHGKKASTGGLLLCTKETKGTALQATSVRVADIKEAITTTKAKLVILVFDCCYSGEAVQAFKGGDVSTHLWDELGRPEGKYLMTSSSMTQPSVERQGDANSLFTKWLVRGLDTWGAARDQQEVIYLKDLFEYVKKNVEDENPAQVPQYKGFETTDVPVAIARRLGATAILGILPTVPIPYLEAVRDLVDSNEVIFFLGDGVYRDGPLSSPQLVEAIGKAMVPEVPGETSLPTAAERYLRYLSDRRPSFLRHFRNILSEHQKEASPLPAVHEMLARLPPPWLVISTTHDLLLERYLEAQHLPFVVVTHILRDLRGDEATRRNGKILVMRRGPQPKNEIVAADELPDIDQDRVVYKLLGSPCFGDWQDPASEIDPASLDTVVVTEDDHVTFVGLLRNEKTRIPEAFSLPFRRKSVVFLGYNLDTWHYRLVATVFKETVPASASQSQEPYAVRLAKSPIEDLFWEKLHARMIQVDPETFIRRLEAARLES
jgi:caspase domain-containing protein/SIR2-like protein